MRIDYNLLEKLYNEKRGIPSRVAGRIVTFYVKKARTCKNCYFLTQGWIGNEFIDRGCYYFNNDNGKPKGLCIPIRETSFLSEIHANNIGIWIEKNLTIND